MKISKQEMEDLQCRTNTVRQHIVRMIANANAGHPGGALSAVDVIVCLYFKLMHVNPQNPNWTERDRFILSKGHASPALYATLAEKGYFPVEKLLTFDHVNSILQGHPDMTRTPGVDMSTGSLGQGLSVGIGIALGERLNRSSSHTYVMMGDGELQEGQVWEAAMLADKYHVDNLTAIVDTNGLQLLDKIDLIMPSSHPMIEKWQAFGWNVMEMKGHDIENILDVIDQARQHKGQPTIIFSYTIKGKGVSYMENNPAWHSRGITSEELDIALKDLNAKGEM